MDNNKITCQSGFTLLEVLIALLIFSVGILGVKSMQLTSIKGNSKANRITAASNVAVDQLETFLALDYSDPALDDDGNPTISFRPNAIPTANGGGFGSGSASLISTNGKGKKVIINIAGNIRIE